MATYNRQTLVASHGNFGLKAADEALYLNKVGQGMDKAGPTLNLRSGEFVLYDPVEGLTAAAGDIATAKNIKFGVGVGKGVMADQVRWIAGDDLNLCNGVIGASAEKPSCGTPQVVDTFFTASDCGVGHSIAVLLDDSVVRSRYNFNERAEYVFTSIPECLNCTDCDPSTTCDEVVNGLVEQINKTAQFDITTITRFPYSNQTNQYQPFTAAKLYSNSYSFDFSLQSEQTEIRRLTITAGGAGSGTGSVVLDGATAVDATITDSTDAAGSAAEIAAETYPGWTVVYQAGNVTIDFVKNTTGASAGAFSYTSTGNETGAFTLLEEATSGGCGKCNFIGAIDGLKINEAGAGDGDEDDVDFTFTVNPDDASQTLPEQLNRVIALINDAFVANGDYNGTAFLSKGVGSCCDYTIEVNTDDANFVLKGNGSDIEATSTADPFAATTATCGIRFFAHPLSLDCNCEFPPNSPVPNYYGRTLDVQAHEDWDCADFTAVETVAQEIPRGFGFFYQDLEQYQHTGGSGRNYRMSNRHVGTIGLPDSASRVSNGTVNCDETYCVYVLETYNAGPDSFNNYVSRQNVGVDRILIPEGDSATRAAVETVLDAILARNGCGLANITCATQQVTAGDSYPDVNR